MLTIGNCRRSIYEGVHRRVLSTLVYDFEIVQNETWNDKGFLPPQYDKNIHSHSLLGLLYFHILQLNLY